MKINHHLCAILVISLLFASCTAQSQIPTSERVPLVTELAPSTLSPTFVSTTAINPLPLTSPTSTPKPALPPEFQAYLDHALDLIQQESVYSAATDWDKLRSQVNEFAMGSQSIPELYPAIQLALTITGDRHGYLMPPLDVQTYFGEQPSENLPAIHQELLQGRFGLIAVPTFASGNETSVQQYVGQLQDAIRNLDAQHPCGWIIDLRNNEGGNGFAMLAGLSLLLGDAEYGYHTYANGEMIEWRSQDGKILFGETVLVELSPLPSPISRPGQPVAVLTSEITTSAGEMVAIAFRDWPNTRSFGQKTLGRTTAPEGFMLSDGAILGISVAYFTDHNGKIYTDKVIPDKVIVDHANPVFRDQSVPQPAIDWLLSQPACLEF